LVEKVWQEVTASAPTMTAPWYAHERRMRTDRVSLVIEYIPLPNRLCNMPMVMVEINVIVVVISWTTVVTSLAANIAETVSTNAAIISVSYVRIE
jgi:hypothetical protein